MSKADGSPWSFDGHDDDADMENWPGLSPETWMELCESIISIDVAPDGEGFDLASGVMVLWAAAQDTAFENKIDIRDEIFLKLDWSEEDKAHLHTVELIQIWYGCSMRNEDPEKHGEHSIPLAQIVRIGSDKTTEREEDDWDPRKVMSDYNFDMVIEQIANDHHKGKMHTFQSHGRVISSRVRQSFANHFAKRTEAKVEKEVNEFRKELDQLFPSAPEKGGNT